MSLVDSGSTSLVDIGECFIQRQRMEEKVGTQIKQCVAFLKEMIHRILGKGIAE